MKFTVVMFIAALAVGVLMLPVEVVIIGLGIFGVIVFAGIAVKNYKQWKVNKNICARNNEWKHKRTRR